MITDIKKNGAGRALVSFVSYRKTCDGLFIPCAVSNAEYMHMELEPMSTAAYYFNNGVSLFAKGKDCQAEVYTYPYVLCNDDRFHFAGDRWEQPRGFVPVDVLEECLLENLYEGYVNL